MFSLRNYTFLRYYNHFNSLDQVRSIKRWVAPTLKELMKRRRKLGPEPIRPRSSFLEWNYSGELFAFGKRLNEEFDLNKLQAAFTHQSYIEEEKRKQRNVGIEEPDINLEDNRKLIEKGEQLLSEYVPAFLKFSLPNLPDNHINEIYKYLVSEETLAYVSSNLGTKDLVLSTEFPVNSGTLRDTITAVIGALEESSGTLRAYTFIRDFICTQLNQKDLLDILQLDDPLGRLKDLCKTNNLGEPEPRLIGDTGKGTVLGTYYVAIYCNKKHMGSGFGESVDIAVDMAATDCLRSLYGTHDDMKPFNFNVELKQIDRFKKLA